jgi:hypothetical protein
MRLFRLLVSAFRRSRVGGLAECEHVGLNAGGEESDLEGAVGDRAPLANQLTELRLDQGSMARFVDVEPLVVAGRFPSTSTRNGTDVPRSRCHMTRWTSRAWKRNAIHPSARFSMLARPSIVQSPDRAHWLSLNESGATWGEARRTRHRRERRSPIVSRSSPRTESGARAGATMPVGQIERDTTKRTAVTEQIIRPVHAGSL